MPAGNSTAVIKFELPQESCSPHPEQTCYFVGEFCQQPAISQVASRGNQAYSAITGVMALNDSPDKGST